MGENDMNKGSNVPRNPSRFRLAMGALVFLGLVLFLSSGIYFLFCSATVIRFDKPLTYAEASTNKDIDFPFPASSHDIYYGFYADWQAYTRIARFEAPVQDCIHQIDTVVAWDNRIYHRTSSYPHITITNVAPQGAGWLKSASWFTPETITNGIYAGLDSSHTPQIWVDTNRGIFYFMEND